MRNIDVFNGDADGICALLQLRLAEPRDSVLVTGVKRDIRLVVGAGIEAGDRVTVLDVSFDKNRDGVMAALEQGATVFYVDHHFAGEVPEHPNLTTLINPAPEVCTSLLVNGHLDGAFSAWAVVGAYGDNLDTSAGALADTLGLEVGDRSALRELGILINYNGYGATPADLHCHPADLFRALLAWPDPLAFLASTDDTLTALRDGYAADMDKVATLKPTVEEAAIAVYVLPEDPWARRVSGVFGNQLANAHPERAHAVLSVRPEGGYLVSVRAPLTRREGADTLCRQFATGGGRAAAAGINHLPESKWEAFVAAFRRQFAPT